MEGVRGFAVFLVFLVHYAGIFKLSIDRNSITYSLSDFTQYVGNIGVDIFFVLSGYLIYGSLISKNFNILKYLGKRVKRIFPTFIFILIIYSILSALVPSESRFPTGFISSIIYFIQNILLLPGIFDIKPIITVSWSLSYEMLFYITIPLLITLFRLKQYNKIGRRIFFIVIICAMLFFDVLHSHLRMMMFAVGILVYETFESDQSALMDIMGALSIPASLIGFWYLKDYDITYRMIWLGFWCYFMLLAAISMNGMTNSFFNFNPMRFLGNISYSYFLVHGIVLKAIHYMHSIMYGHKLLPITYYCLFMPIAFVLTILFTLPVFYFVEKKYSM